VSRVPPDRLLVAESGIGERGDVERLAKAGVGAYLVGSAFMAAEDPGKMLSGLFFAG
jgi:indole-3-glycerol phosphate synthase